MYHLNSRLVQVDSFHFQIKTIMSDNNNNNNNPQAGQGRPLPKKEQDKFREVVKHYETKQYKKGAKAADAILKKFPRHGETLCMKGLILNSMGSGLQNRDEAIAMVKMGLMNDMRWEQARSKNQETGCKKQVARSKLIVCRKKSGGGSLSLKRF